ncbi:5-hydroxytryptamine receptor 3A-like [Acipenser oxyrinchus oxyrinchus]|uniref:5-hydroxytryptamine receptor 3A n=1 Tax=Acipenser oxyrinchus oxyrinchus TaxID=40147 RepID=A0AAD8DES5_ACIOX|nr:5-hydroxytryptamine receptor 3A-like [Acipenser oxyrinchus oxyrinchus]
MSWVSISRYLTLTIFIAVLLFKAGCTADSKNNHSESVYMRFYKRFQTILDTPGMRPSSTWREPTHINLSINIKEIIGVDEKTHILITFIAVRQLWFNEFLVWDPNEFDGLDHVTVPVEFIWTPDFYIYEFVGEDLSPFTPYLSLHHDGKVIHDKPIRAVTSCNLDIFYFPFDTHSCILTFGLYLHTVNDVGLGLLLPSEQLLKDSLQSLGNRGEWELLNITGNPVPFHSRTENWAMCVFTVKIRRRPIMYLIKLVIPSALLVLLDIMSFFLPIHSVDRCAFKVTLLLGYSMFLLMMNNILPNNSGGTPLIGGYFLVCMALLVASLLESIFISNVLHRKSLQDREVPGWVRTLVLHKLAQLICYKKKVSNKQQDEENIYTIHINKTENPVWKTSSQTPTSMEMRLLTFLKRTCEDVQVMRDTLKKFQARKKSSKEWMEVSYVLDILLFLLYILFIAVTSVCLCVLWSHWYRV